MLFADMSDTTTERRGRAEETILSTWWVARGLNDGVIDNVSFNAWTTVAGRMDGSATSESGKVVEAFLFFFVSLLATAAVRISGSIPGRMDNG
jgi:hypothetical protein